MDNRFEALSVQVLEWAEQRGLLKKENANKQFIKFIEEAGELARGVIKQDKELTIDSIGDVLVTLIILSEQLGYDPVKCLQVAYNEISNRKGKTVDGVFIKSE